MSKKGLYKKTVGHGWDRPEGSQRTRENRFFEKVQSGKVSERSKSKAKGAPRSNHKHEYKHVIVWYKGAFNGKVYSDVCRRCNICGKIEKGRYSNDKKEEKYLGELEHFFEDENKNITCIDGAVYQKTIFLGGSKTITELNENIKNRLISFMNHGHKLLIGDCVGADLQMQKLLVDIGYQRVVVYYSGDRPRVNLGNWKTKHVSSNKALSDFERQTLKGNQMAIDANEGFMLLNGPTKGTMANIFELLNQKKECEVYLTDCARFYAHHFTVYSEKGIERIKWHYEHR